VKAGKAMGKSAGQLNKLVNDIKASLNQIYHKQQRRDNYVTAEKVKNEFLGHTENYETLLNLFEKHNNDVKALIGISKSASTYQKYEVTRKHLGNFI
jgi:inactivated superfamily I helicase